MNITPEQISNLKPNEVFVFGSNLQGIHAGGAARFAVLKFGAEMGNPNGIQGQSYAIPTLSKPGGLPNHKLPLSEIGKYVNEFISFASQHPNVFFYVTPIGCGIAGFTEEEIAPLFSECINMENIALPKSFFSVLGVQENNTDEIINDTMMENKQIIELSEAQLHRIIKESVNRLLTEASNNIPFKRFNAEMKKYGFVPRKGKSSTIVYTLPEYGTPTAITIHIHGDNDSVKADSLRHTRQILQAVGWFNNRANVQMWLRNGWGLPLP